MTPQEEFSVWFAGSMLRANGREVQSMELDAIAAEAGDGSSLDEALGKASQHETGAGDFGLEFVAALVVPILVEVGKQLWAAYSKKLVEETGGELAKLTVGQVRSWVSSFWKDKPAQGQQELVAVVRRIGAERGLSEKQIEELVTLAKNGRLTLELSAA